MSRLAALGVLTAVVAATVATGAGSGGVRSGVTLHHVSHTPRVGIGSDLAFWGNLVFAGGYEGFRVFDVTNSEDVRLLSTFACHGPQGDVSVWKAGERLLLFMSVDRAQSSPRCGGSVDTPLVSVRGGQYAVPGFEGIRIFDVTDPAAPRQIGAVGTSCGSHTHTLVPDPAHRRVLIYVSSYPLGSGRTPPGYTDFVGPSCTTPHAKLPIVEVPYDRPEAAHVLKEQPLSALTQPYEERALGYRVVGCHDVQVFLSSRRKLAAAACMSEAQLWDISDPASPRTLTRITRIRNGALDFWHSAAFTWDGKQVLFGDEAQGPGSTCARGNRRGNIWIYRVPAALGRSAPLLGRFAIPRAQPGYCSVHLFDIVPTRGARRIAVTSAYHGGTSVFDFTRPRAPRELASFAGSNDASGPANTWSAYWYNGLVVANDIDRGVDVFRLSGLPPTRRVGHLNPQTQEVP